MDLSRIAWLKIYFNTVKHLKWTQIWYRFLFTWKKYTRNILRKRTKNIPFSCSNSLKFKVHHFNTASFNLGNKFQFLNKTNQFESIINWNFKEFGKLWTYNLNYFEWLHQQSFPVDTGVNHIYQFIDFMPKAKDGLEPFPTSLRLVNWIKFCLKHQIDQAPINQAVYQQLKWLEQNLEYHLLGNHLMENAVALCFGGYFLNHPKILKKGINLLQQELDEQILADGAHFELSPMYHQLMTYRLLDVINLLDHNVGPEHQTQISTFKDLAAIMLGWLQTVTFKDGSIPMVNDAAPDIAPTTEELVQYGQHLEITPKALALNASGYRKRAFGRFEILIDGGQIGPNYIPGHAHSDITNFVLHIDGQPFIVDTGISTYEKNSRRQYERSIKAHNAVQIQNKEANEVWGGFRVARRSAGQIFKEVEDQIEIKINSFNRYYNQARRTFQFYDGSIDIKEWIPTNVLGTLRLHFSPHIRPQLVGHEIHCTPTTIKFQGVKTIHLEPCEIANGFNKLAPSQKAVITFTGELSTTISIL